MTIVLDASAILAHILEEPGGDLVGGHIAADGIVSMVNLSEVVAKTVERGGTDQQVDAIMEQFRARSVVFDASQARAAGMLRRATQAAGLSFGDRACLALALSLGAPVLTADRAWAGLDVGVAIEVIR